MQVIHLGQKELAERWRMSEATLERWRSDRIGPVFLKIRGRVLYRHVDIEAFEVASLKGTFVENCTPEPMASSSPETSLSPQWSCVRGTCLFSFCLVWRKAQHLDLGFQPLDFQLHESVAIYLLRCIAKGNHHTRIDRGVVLPLCRKS